MVVLPGGLSHGDYLRCAVIAKPAPAMQDVFKYAKKGGFILGICNGSQILLEVGLLKSAMKHNENLNFISKNQTLGVVSNDNAFLKRLHKNELITFPIAHGEGNYCADEAMLKYLEDKDLITLKHESNPNGSCNNTAGICDETEKISGLMPYPERVCEKLLGDDAGFKMFEGFLS